MAKKLVGYKREALEKKILPALGYTGSMDQNSINAFLASNPNAAAKMGRYTLAARQRIEGVRGMSYGGMVKKQGYATGGPAATTFSNDYSTPEKVAAFNADRAPGGVHYERSSRAQAATGAEIAAKYAPGGANYEKSTTAEKQAYAKRIAAAAGTPATTAATAAATAATNAANAANAKAARVARDKFADGYDPEASKAALFKDYDIAAAFVVEKRNALAAATQNLAENPMNAGAKKAMEAAQVALTQAQASETASRNNLNTVNNPTSMTAQALLNPTDSVQKADVATVTAAEKTAGTVATDAGDAGTAGAATTTTAGTAGAVTGPADMTAETYDATKVSTEVKSTLDKLEAATGKPSAEALADAATMKPGDLASLGLTVEQIAEARKVIAPAPRKVKEGEMISGSAVDMDRVKKETNFEAATGAPSSDATVQGQLTSLMEDFEGSEPPAWAAGAMRAAASQMAARGLSASSMAGQAVIQAAMESALPIAVQDAQTTASFEAQNLSNRQQASMFAAEKRAEFLNLEFTQEFQTRVANASKISDIANMNFTADVQIALENAQMAQTVDLTNLSAKNAKVMADAAAMTQTDLTNLNNRQQAAVQTANAFLNMDMKNLDNEQQTSVFKAQEMVNSMLSDQAAVNAAAQFNATSENQTNQFFESLSSQIARFNNEQTNAMSRFNTGESNATSQFNTLQKNARDQFNAQNHLVIAQANAQWFQNITTTENAAENQANRDEVLAANNLTMTAYNNIVQRDRDLLAWAWQSAESQADRDGEVTIAKIAAQDPADSGTDSFSAASGKFLTRLAVNAADKFFNK